MSIKKDVIRYRVLTGVQTCFFFQAEDGIRNRLMTGVQTCALPISGNHDTVSLEEVGVPQWVIDQNLCPGLPNWEALKNCKDVFTTVDSGGKGRILDGPQSWHGVEYTDRVEALLGDDWVVKFARSEEHTSELQSQAYLVCRLLLEKKKKNHT